MNLCLFDYVWRGLSLGAVSVTSLLVVEALVLRWEAIPARARKWFGNFQHLAMLALFAGGFLYLSMTDAGLAAGCFNDFVKQGWPVTRTIALVWSVLAAGGIALDLVRVAAAGFIGAREETGDSTKDLVSELRARFHVDVRVVVSEKNVSPHVFGWLRPVVVIPRVLLHSARANDLRSILAHEFAHVRDGDALWTLVASFLSRVLFFHPLVYLVAALHRRAVEEAADVMAVTTGGVEARDLIRSLLFAAESARPEALMPAASRGYRELRGRILALGAGYARTELRLRSRLVLGLAAVSAFTLSIHQARGSTVPVSRFTQPEVMCRQAADEQALRTWLKMESPVNQCEIRNP